MSRKKKAVVSVITPRAEVGRGREIRGSVKMPHMEVGTGQNML